MCNKTSDKRFSSLGTPKKVWAVGSIHGDLDRLMQLHDAIYQKIAPGDRLVYLGNYTGYGDYSRETIDELLFFRRLILAQPGMKPSDIVYLRGAQEELWQKLTQLQFDQHPTDHLLWLMASGLGKTMESYGICPHDGIMATREGTMSITKWTNKIRQMVRENPGHDCFMMNSRRAAYTSLEDRYPLLFVNAGIDPSKSLGEQEENLWSASEQFDAMADSYAPFEKVVRGYDPNHQGVHLNCITATIDGGCGFGGPLVCANMGADGEFYELMEA